MHLNRLFAAFALVLGLSTAASASVGVFDPDFIWLQPTVKDAPEFTGPFDDTVVDALAVEVCELVGDACVDGPPVERFTSLTSPTPTQIVVDRLREAYSVQWLTGRSHVNRESTYRIRVFLGSREVGAADVQFAQNTPELRSIDSSRFIGVVRGQQLTIRFRIQQPTARTRVRVNEVESQAGVPGDWVELHNSADVAVSLTGYVVKDNDDTHAFTFPDGVTIPAGGFRVVDEADLGFGLGGADSVRFFTGDGKLVDQYDWTAHAPTTYGRCPDGAGAFQITTTVTRGAANDCSIVVRINEVESSGGWPGDWVELYNAGPAPANLGGFRFSDSDNTHSYVLPSVIVPSGGYMVLEEAAFGFGLGSADAARMFRPDGTLADAYEWTAHAPTTYGRCPNGIGDFATTAAPSKGVANGCVVIPMNVFINEIESSGGVPGDWVELINTAASPADVSGWWLLDNDDTHARYILPAGTVIPAGGYLVLEESQFVYGLGAGDTARLFRSNGTLADSYAWTAHAVTTYGRCPNGTGAFATTSNVTKGAANDCSPGLVRINEIESNGGTPGDWAELYNPGNVSTDLSNFVLRDNDDTHTYVIAAGTTLPAGAYLVIDEASLGFGLGGADSVRLFDASLTPVDAYSWTTHATTTYGRCPNGTGSFATTAASTKGAANSCVSAASTVVINEVESNGGTPGDWVELFNTGAAAVDLSGFLMRDNDDTHTYVIPASTTIPAGGYLLLEEGTFGFGLGGADSVRIYDAAGVLAQEYSWAAHAATTYGRCPNGTGPFATATTSTKGAANDCSAPVGAIKINEVESNLGAPGDWVELYNTAAVPVDLTNYVFKDNDDTHSYAIPAGTVLPAGGYLLLDEAGVGFGLGSADSARLFDAVGVLVDSYSWTAHATTTYGRCPNGTGAFTTTTSSTRGGINACPGDPLVWPGDAVVQTADGLNVLGGNMSGLDYEGSGGPTPGVLWAAKNGPGTLYRLVRDNVNNVWMPDTSNGWSAGKPLRYPDGTGDPDAEGVVRLGTSLYVSTERNNAVNGTSRNAILRFDATSADTTLTAAQEWNLTADLPVVGANLGLEAITWIPDTFLVGGGFADQSKGANVAYNPADYPDHGTGLFFVGVEANGAIYAYALNHTNGSFTRISTFASGFAGVMDLHFDSELSLLWAVCDDTCQGQSAVMQLQPGTGTFGVMKVVSRPASMPNLNNEGFTVTPLAECAAGQRPAFWADDSNTGGNAIRSGSVSCSAP